MNEVVAFGRRRLHAIEKYPKNVGMCSHLEQQLLLKRVSAIERQLIISRLLKKSVSKRKMSAACIIECVMHFIPSQVQPALGQISNRDFRVQHFCRIGEPTDPSQVITVRCARNNCHRCL